MGAGGREPGARVGEVEGQCWMRLRDSTGTGGIRTIVAAAMRNNLGVVYVDWEGAQEGKEGETEAQQEVVGQGVVGQMKGWQVSRLRPILSALISGS